MLRDLYDGKWSVSDKSESSFRNRVSCYDRSLETTDSRRAHDKLYAFQPRIAECGDDRERGVV